MSELTLSTLTPTEAYERAAYALAEQLAKAETTIGAGEDLGQSLWSLLSESHRTFLISKHLPHAHDLLFAGASDHQSKSATMASTSSPSPN